MAARRKRRTPKRRKTKTLTERVTALERAISPRRKRGKGPGIAAALAAYRGASDSGPKYIGAYRVPG